MSFYSDAAKACEYLLAKALKNPHFYAPEEGKTSKRERKARMGHASRLDRTREIQRLHKLGYCYEDIAAQVGVCRSTVTRLITGDVNLLAPDERSKIAALARKGIPSFEIARTMQRAEGTVSRVLVSMGLNPMRHRRPQGA